MTLNNTVRLLSVYLAADLHIFKDDNYMRSCFEHEQNRPPHRASLTLLFNLIASPNYSAVSALKKAWDDVTWLRANSAAFSKSCVDEQVHCASVSHLCRHLTAPHCRWSPAEMFVEIRFIYSVLAVYKLLHGLDFICLGVFGLWSFLLKKFLAIMLIIKLFILVSANEVIEEEKKHVSKHI